MNANKQMNTDIIDEIMIVQLKIFKTRLPNV